jgi:hypothetical protein
MEQRLGHDFGGVRVHTDPQANAVAAELGALAFAYGPDIGFARGRYDPGTPRGRRLLAHELIHVAQQASASVSQGVGDLTVPPSSGQGDRMEQQARAAARDVGGGHRRTVGISPGPRELRLAEPEDAESSAGGGGLGPVIDVGGGVQVQLLTTGAERLLPDWIPGDLRQQILNDELPAGVTRRPGDPPWGDLVVWVGGPGAVSHIEVYQEFPEDETFYRGLMEGNAYAARVLTDVHTQFNRDMAYFVDGKGYSPHHARNELQAINEEVFRLVIQAAGEVYAGGFDLGAFRTLYRSLGPHIVDAAERTAFTRRAPGPAAVPADVALPPPGPMPEKLTSGIVSQAPPTRVVGDMIEGQQVVRKTVASDTPLGGTRFGKMWGAESIRAQEAALRKLEAAGIDTARIRQSFSDTGELILDYAGESVEAQWATMGPEGRQAFNDFVWHAKQEMGIVHDLKKRNIAYQRHEIDGQVLHRFVVFDPAFDRYSMIVATAGGVGLSVIGTVTIVGLAQALTDE